MTSPKEKGPKVPANIERLRAARLEQLRRRALPDKYGWRNGEAYLQWKSALEDLELDRLGARQVEDNLDSTHSVIFPARRSREEI